MSKYDKDRMALGLKPLGESETYTTQPQSKYAAEREALFNPKPQQQPKIAEIPKRSFLDVKEQIDEKLKASATMAPKADIKEDEYIDQTENIGGYVFGTNVLPVKKTDPFLAKAGKSVVNWVAGIPGAIGNVFGMAAEPLRQAAIQSGSLIQGKGLQPLRKTEFVSDILPSKASEGLRKLQQEKPIIGGFATMAIDTVADPFTYVGGGILDDLARQGRIGASARIGTVEGLKRDAALGQKVMSKIGKQTAKSADDLARQATKSADDIIEQMDTVAKQSDTPKVFGEVPKGEIPEGMMERGFSRNIRTDVAMPDDIRQLFDESPLAYEQLSNQTTLKKAQDILDLGEEAATAEFYRSLGAKEFKPETVPLSKMLAKQAREAGNVDKARQILSDMAVQLTEAGQFTQSAKILREADPETFLYTIQKQIKKLNEQGAKQYKKIWTNIDLLPEEITAISKLTPGDEAAYEALWEQIGKRIAKDLPSTNIEKFDAWRRMAMLLNPKTHIRNVVGNVLMGGMQKTSDTLAAGLERIFIPKGQRTKSFLWSLDDALKGKVDDVWDAVKKDILGESRWKIDNITALGREKNIYKTPALQWLNDVSLKTLNLEDNIFSQRAFKDSLGQFMHANGLTEATDVAIDYAKRRSLEATYRQANKVADMLNKLKRTPGVGKVVEAAIPFTKTPANLMKTAFEYSPGGLLKTLYDVGAGKTATTVIEDLTKGLTGTAISGLGFTLASMGWAKTSPSKSGKVSAIESELGEQPYSIITPQGSYTFDWAQPFAVPLAMGVAMYEGIKDKENLDYDAIIESIAQGGDSYFNMSMMQNVKKLLGGAGSTTESLLGLPWEYVQQAWPSIFGQVAKTVDDTRRSYYDPNKWKQTLNVLKSRIPGVSQTLEPALNVWGEEQKQGGIIQQFINPGYGKERSDDPVTLEVARLHAEFGDNDMLPKAAQNFIIGGVRTELTPQQMTEFQRTMGQANYQDIKKLIESSSYQRISDENKVKKIKKIVNNNYEEAKRAIIRGR